MSEGIRQTVFGDDGNCLRATVATITGVSLEEVVDVLDGQQPEVVWFERLEDWAGQRGWTLDVRSPLQPPAGLALASGPTVRGPQTHSIVAKDGTAWWDPHPSDLFISSVDYYIAFERVGEPA